jgi:hypothetical protein
MVFTTIGKIIGIQVYFSSFYITIQTMIAINFGCRRRIVLVTATTVSKSRSGLEFLLEACFQYYFWLFLAVLGF